MVANKSLENLDIFQSAIGIGEYVWKLVNKWDHFAKSTVGEQFVEAADSISANIAEGYGRYFFKERRKFYFYSRGSLLETKNWTIKSRNRSLISPSEYEYLIQALAQVHIPLNSYIQMITWQIKENKDEL